MDAGKQILNEEKRKQRAKDVVIQFIDDKCQHFNVLSIKDEYDRKNPELLKIKAGDVKHLGVILGREPNQKDFCTCESFYFGNSDEYKKANPAAFQCKHIIEARETRYAYYPEAQ